MRTRTLFAAIVIMFTASLCVGADGVLEFTNGTGTITTIIPIGNGARVKIESDTNLSAVIALNLAQAVAATNYQAATNQAGVIALSVARQHAATNVHLADDIIVSNSVTAQSYQGDGSDLTGVLHPGEAVAVAAGTNIVAVTNAGVVTIHSTATGTGGSINTNTAVAFKNLGADTLNVATQTVATLTANAIYDSAGSTGAVGRVLVPVTGGGYAWSNSTSLVSAWAGGSTNQTTIGTNDSFQGNVSAVGFNAESFTASGTGYHGITLNNAYLRSSDTFTILSPPSISSYLLFDDGSGNFNLSVGYLAANESKVFIRGRMQVGLSGTDSYNSFNPTAALNVLGDATVTGSISGNGSGLTNVPLTSASGVGLQLGAFTNIICGRIPIVISNVTYYLTLSTNAP